MIYSVWMASYIVCCSWHCEIVLLEYCVCCCCDCITHQNVPVQMSYRYPQLCSNHYTQCDMLCYLYKSRFIYFSFISVCCSGCEAGFTSEFFFSIMSLFIQSTKSGKIIFGNYLFHGRILPQRSDCIRLYMLSIFI